MWEDKRHQDELLGGLNVEDLLLGKPQNVCGDAAVHECAPYLEDQGIQGQLLDRLCLWPVTGESLECLHYVGGEGLGVCACISVSEGSEYQQLG